MTNIQRKASASDNSRRPILLAPDNFTPRTRTPWAGTEIHSRFKAVYSQETHIGESWEISCDPAFPSVIVDESDSRSDRTLQGMIDQDPTGMISPQLAWAASNGATCELLVKLVNAASPLSLQIHPDDNNQSLRPDECGKPESWLILHAQPGSGIYLGFKRPWTSDTLRTALQTGKFSAEDLFFIPVQENDYFEIGPGIVHAIGPGVTLLEPQRIRRGKSGKTYRMWDWNRRYDNNGHEDLIAGRPRELHIDQAMQCFDPTTQCGPQFAASLMRKAARQNPATGIHVSTWPANQNYQVHRIQMMADTDLRINVAKGEGYGGLTILSGSVDYNGTRLSSGTSAFMPWRSLPASLKTALGVDFALITHAAMSIDIAPAT
jgi:mannose-6-phosphate isomerase